MIAEPENEFEQELQGLIEYAEQEQLAEDPGDRGKYYTALGQRLRALFDDAVRDRQDIETEWLSDLRQFKGQYDPDVLAQMHAKRSKAFLSITRTKVRTVTARICDLLFPANGDRNWNIAPTPLPELGPEVKQDIMTQLTEIMGAQPSEEQMRNVLFEEAKKRCDAMRLEIEDQLAEIKYRDIIRQVVNSGNIYGTGILKGPLVKRQTAKRWAPAPTGEWMPIEMERQSPYCEFIPIWDFYPDMSTSRMDDVRFAFQRHKMPRHKVLLLAKRPGFNREAILDYIKQNDEGDADVLNFENELDSMSQDGDGKQAITATRGRKYEVLEFWGYVLVKNLQEAGVTIEEEDGMPEVAANVWLLGDRIIKAVLTPIDGVEIPYFCYYYEKDETSIFGEGLPRIMRDPQKLFNASVRAMLDNAAISAGPIIEANTDLLAPDEDPTDIYPFRVFQRNGQGVEANAKAINVYGVPSYTGEYMNMVQFFMSTADEVTTVPRYLYGSDNVGGAGRTASGLSMLMGAANITIKDQIKNFDDGITKPFIRAMYSWNMDFNPKPTIKGDFAISAEGTTSLMAKEVFAEQILQWLNITNNPVDLQYTNRDVALRETAKAFDLDGLSLVKNPDQIKQEQEAAGQQAQADREFAQQIELLKAKSSGHVNDQGGANSGPVQPMAPPPSSAAPQVGGMM